MKRLLLLAALSLCLPGTSQAQVVLDKVYLTLDKSRKPLENVNVLNESDQPLAVKVEVVEVLNKSLPNESEVTSQDVRVSPSRFELAPRGERLTRIIYTQPFGEKERIFRVRYTPTSESLVAAPALPDPNAKVTKLDVQVGMGLLLGIAPLDIKPNLTFTRTSEGIRFTNQGNVHVMLRRTKHCPEVGKYAGQCFDLPGSRIYPGETWQTEGLPTDLPLVYYQYVYGKETPITIPAATASR
jgi:P pilus assembly chaperone PapD